MKKINAGYYTDIATYEAGIVQAIVNRKLQKYCDDILKPFGITKSQWLVIGTIKESGDEGVRLTELAEKTDTTLAYLTNTINLLESKGMLVRISEKKDTRAKRISVDASFIKECDVIEKALREGLKSMLYKNIEPAEFQIYMKVLRLMADIDI